MNELIIELGKIGGLGIVLAWSLYRNEKLTDRLFTVIENNTKVMQSVKRSMEDCSK